MTDTIYLRNRRPNRVVLRYAELRVVLERRGSREDSVSLPADALQDATIARWLRSEMIEQISKEAFLELASRADAFDPNTRSEDEPITATDIRKAEIPMSTDPRTPTVIDTDKIDRSMLTPRVEFAETQPDTNEELNLAPQEVSVHDLHRGETGRPMNLGDSPNRDLIGEGERPNVLDLAAQLAAKDEEESAPAKKPAARKPAARKRATTTRKSTKK